MRNVGGQVVAAVGKYDQPLARVKACALGEQPAHGLVHVVAQPVAGQVNGSASDVHDLDPVGIQPLLVGNAGRVGGLHLVDLEHAALALVEAGKVALVPRLGVLIAGGIIGSLLPARALADPADVAHGGGAGYGVHRRAAREQIQRLVGAELEARVQLAGCVGAVLARQEHHAVFAGLQRHRGQWISGGVVLAVGQRVARQRQRARCGVVQLHPAGVVAVRVAHGHVVLHHQLGQHQPRGAGGQVRVRVVRAAGRAGVGGRQLLVLCEQDHAADDGHEHQQYDEIGQLTLHFNVPFRKNAVFQHD